MKGVHLQGSAPCTLDPWVDPPPHVCSTVPSPALFLLINNGRLAGNNSRTQTRAGDGMLIHRFEDVGARDGVGRARGLTQACLPRGP